MSARNSFCVVATPTLIYAGPQSAEEFERIALPENVPGDWEPDPVAALVECDGRAHQRRVRSKTLGELGGGQGPVVVLQYWERRVVEAAAPAKAVQA